MGKEKVRIIAMLNGVPQGYVKSVSYTKGTFKLTQSKANAKTFATLDGVQNEIDTLARISYGSGYVFMYD